jgi:uncharacterized protein (TIGR02246 family)
MQESITMRFSRLMLRSAAAAAAVAGAGAFGPAASAQAVPGSQPIAGVTDANAGQARMLADVAAAYEKAFAAGDAAGLAAMFTTDAEIADEEGVTKGRDVIQQRFQRYFAEHPGVTLKINIGSLKFFGTDVAFEEGRAVVTIPNAPTETTKYTVVYVKKDGAWLQASCRDELVDDATRTDRLKELEWLVGEWVNESSESVVRTVCRWSDDKNYLIRDFTVSIQGKPRVNGVQRITWDPSKRQIRSWIFDTDGGFSEDYWSRIDDRWTMKSHGVHASGKAFTATMTITHVGPNRLIWATSDRTVGADTLPDNYEFTMVRQPPSPKTVTVAPIAR